MPNVINCPFCGKLTDPKLESCPHCGGYMRKRPEPEARQGAGQTPLQPQTCPNCHALVQDGDIICVACGTNLLTGQKVAEEKAKKTPAKLPKLPALYLAGGAAALVLVLLIVMLAYLLFSRDPVRQALQLALAGNDLEACDMLKTHIEKRPDDVRAHRALGKVYWSMNQLPNAAASFEAASRLEPTDLDTAMLAVAGLAGIRDESMPKRTAERQVAVLERVVREFPDKARAWYLLGLAQGKSGDVTGQTKALKEAISLGHADAGARQCLGIALALENDYAMARGELEAVSDQSADALAALGFVASLEDDAEKAGEYLGAAISGRTSVTDQALVRLGLVLVSQSEFAEADAYLIRALEADKTNDTARYFRGVCLQSKGLTEEALRAFVEVSQGKSEWAFEAMVRVIELNVKLDNLQSARSALTRAQDTGKTSAPLYTAKGLIHAAGGEDGLARDAFNKALQIDDGYAPAHLENGLLYVKQQLFSEGVHELEQYLESVGMGAPGARTLEIETLVTQLKLTLGTDRRPLASAATSRGRNAS